MGIYEATRDLLLANRYGLSELPRLNGPGICAYYLETAGALRGVNVRPSGLLFIGKTSWEVGARNNFRHSGLSPLRRTLGALLKTELQLRVIRQGQALTLSNCRNYRFTDDGERRLSAWMEFHLACSQAPLAGDWDVIEKRLVVELEPPLNVNGWDNPEADRIKNLRRACRFDARGAARAMR